MLGMCLSVGFFRFIFILGLWLGFGFRVLGLGFGSWVSGFFISFLFPPGTKAMTRWGAHGAPVWAWSRSETTREVLSAK